MTQNETTSLATALPEPNFIERDIDKITQEWVSYYETRTGKVLQPAQLERILIDMGVYRENLLRIKIQETAKQNLVNYAKGVVLDYLGFLVGVERLLAQRSKTVIRFRLLEVLDFDLAINENTQIESKDSKVIFKTTETKTIVAGEEFIDIEAVAITPGTQGNGYLAGEVNSLLTPLPYITIVENIELTAGGADEETDDQLRERIKQAPESFSNAGCKGAYKFHAFSSHPNIIDVEVISPSAGVIEIYPLTKDGVPTQSIIDIAQKYINQDHIRALTDYVEVKPSAKIDFGIDATLTLYSFADAQTVWNQANDVLLKYISELKKKLGKSIIQTQIISILNSIYGVFKVSLTAPQETILEKYQFANCTGITVQIGGYVDE